MSVKYNLIPTTSVQPPAPTAGGLDRGFRAGDLVQFVMNFPGEEMIKSSLRLNGKIQWWYVPAGGVVAAVPKEDRIWLNSNAGINGIIKNIVGYSNDRIVESISEFARSVALTQETSQHQINLGVSAQSMLELQRFDNDSYDNTAEPDSKMLSFNGGSNANLTELPFSTLVPMCFNKSNVNLRYSDVGMLKLDINLQENTKVGFRGTLPDASYFYTVTELEVRTMTQPEQPKREPLVLDVVQNCAVQTIQNRYSSLTFPVSQPFYSIVAGLVQTPEVVDDYMVEYDYLSSDALAEKAELVEYKLNNIDSALGPQFPLQHQAAEILYNYILAVHGDTDKPIPHHALSYAKLSKNKGYGLGCFFGELLPAMTTASINVLLREEPALPYQVFIFALGKVKF
jgi:hypothetical protein